MLYDAFICHASEDKENFVRPLAEQLKEHHLEIWYDEFSMSIGDSLRRSIDKGLTQSRYGIVVLSKTFFEKEWPQWELDGLVQRQNSEQQTVVLPIWHNISHEEILAYSPSLADKIATESRFGIEHVVTTLLRVLKPEGSTLLIARDILIEKGMIPPVVTDDWWLDVVAFSAANPVEGTFQEASGWGRWGFPLPAADDSPRSRGTRLAQAALQQSWQAVARKQRISQISHPSEVHTFIERSPGLEDTCWSYPGFLLAYAPQLSIRGFGGQFEELFDDMFEESRAETYQLIRGRCALRDESFCGCSPTDMSQQFVCLPDAVGTAPEVRFYETIDYIAWFLSDQSSWMPEKIREFLLSGLVYWPQWEWWDDGSPDYNFGFKRNSNTGTLAISLARCRKASSFKLSKSSRNDLLTRLEFSITLLGLPETASEISKRFIDRGFIQGSMERMARLKQRIS
jgi:hypothetical protein